MEINTRSSGIDSGVGQQEARRLVEEALEKINPQYVALFDKIGGVISIEQVIDGDPALRGRSRFPENIAIQTSELSSDTLDRVLTEEIIHYLDHHLQFSERKVFNMQAAANADAQHPLSLAMLVAVRGGTKGVSSIEELLQHPDAHSIMAEFNKELPFLGGYRRDHNMNKYEWLAEVEHAEQTLSRIPDGEKASLLAVRAQQNMFMVLSLRFLSNHGLDLMNELQKKNLAEVFRKMDEIIDRHDAKGWIDAMAAKVDTSGIPAPRPPRNSYEKIGLAVAYHLSMKKYPLSDMVLKNTMIAMFPESYYALQSFRDEVDRELASLNRQQSVVTAAAVARRGGNIREHVSIAGMDEVSLRELASRLRAQHPEVADGIASTLAIQALIKTHKPGDSEPKAQVTALLETAWPELPIDGKNIMAYAVDRELYGIAAAIRDRTRKSAPGAPPRPPFGG